MELHRGDRQLAERQPFDRAVIEGHMRDLRGAEIGFEVSPAVRYAHRETVVLGGHEHAPRVDLEHWMVRAAMAEAELERLQAQRPSEQLVAEADAEHRHP